MFLDSATKSLLVQVVEASTLDSSWVIHYVDYTSSATTPDSLDGKTNGTAAVTMLPGIGGVQRHVKHLTIFNEDTTPHTYKVRLLNGTDYRTLVAITIAPQQTLQYTTANGWEVVPPPKPVNQSVSANISGANTWTTPLLVYAGDVVSISVTGVFDAAVSLQRMLDGTTYNAVTLPDGSTGWSAPVQMTYIADETGYVRIGVPLGAYVSGTAAVRLGKN